MALSAADYNYLRLCVDLAQTALYAGDEPFGSVLVNQFGDVLFQDHNHVASGDATQHPEFAIARWAATNLSPEERAHCVVYTSGEHCPMCAAAHAWVGLGKIVYATSGQQLRAWLQEWQAPLAPVAALSITDVAPNIETEGPVEEFEEEMRDLYRQAFIKK